MTNIQPSNPVVYVGLGGFGGALVNTLAGRLQQHAHWNHIQERVHFLIVDANRSDLDQNQNVPPACRFLISGPIDHYLRRKRGQLARFPPDPMVNQWFSPDVRVLESGPRSRVGNRLCLYHNLENDRAGMRRQLRGLLQAATRPTNPWLDTDTPVVRVVLCGTLAGGMGSGSLMTIAYLLRQMVQDNGWGRPIITAMLSPHTTFINQSVTPVMREHLHANSYASLKEIEYLNRNLGGYPGGTNQIRFHLPPETPDDVHIHVADRPFDVAYLMDRPEELSADAYTNAIVDALTLHGMSSLQPEGMPPSAHKPLAQGLFSTDYGCLATARLMLPRTALIRYAALRYSARACREFLSFGIDTPSLEGLAPDERNRTIDQTFVAYVTRRAEQEHKNDAHGVFSAIDAQTGKGGKPLREAFQALLLARFARLDALMEIPAFKVEEISEGNPSISRQVNELWRACNTARSRVISEELATQKTALQNGSFLEAFFTDHDVNPIAQRLFLIRLLSEDFIVPFSDPEEGMFLQRDTAWVDLNSADVQDRVGQINDALATAAKQPFFQRLLNRNNQKFTDEKQLAVDFLNELAAAQRTSLQRDFWQSYQEALRQVSAQQLAVSRMVAEIADTQAREADGHATAFQHDPATWSGSDIAQYAPNAEVLRDDGRQERLWDLFFRHNLDRPSFFKTEDIFPLVTQAFLSQRSRDASEIVHEVRLGLIEKANAIYTRALGPMGMDLDLNKGLSLEQRYIALLDDGQDIETLHKTGKLDEAVRAVSKARVRRGIEDKLQRLSDECVILAHVDQVQRDDPTVTPADVFYAGIADRYDTEEDDSLGQVLRGVVSGLSFVSGWNAQDSIVLYKGILGIPVYFFKNVRTELEAAYKKVAVNPNRGYPLHIEHSWDGLEGLPNLNPAEQRRAKRIRNSSGVCRRG